MASKKRDPADDRNISFEVTESVLEKIKPGYADGKKKRGKAAAESDSPGGGRSRPLPPLREEGRPVGDACTANPQRTEGRLEDYDSSSAGRSLGMLVG